MNNGGGKKKPCVMDDAKQKALDNLQKMDAS
jgi:hypothetical protein